jgi:hypothetical protein
MLFNNDAITSSLYIMNNVFYNSTEWGIRWTRRGNIRDVTLDNNCWFETSGSLARIENNYYDFESQWEEYQATSGQDAHSIAADPLLKPDCSLQDNSPCVDAGIALSIVTQDYNCISRPQGSGFDIGAFESNAFTVQKDKNGSDEVLICSNPVNDILIIVTPIVTNKSKVTIYNLNGQELLNQQIHSIKTEINVGNLSKGIYIVKIVNDKSDETKKVIKT